MTIWHMKTHPSLTVIQLAFRQPPATNLTQEMSLTQTLRFQITTLTTSHQLLPTLVLNCILFAILVALHFRAHLNATLRVVQRQLVIPITVLQATKTSKTFSQTQPQLSLAPKRVWAISGGKRISFTTAPTTSKMKLFGKQTMKKPFSLPEIHS